MSHFGPVSPESLSTAVSILSARAVVLLGVGVCCVATRTQDNTGKLQILGLFPAPMMLESGKFSITVRFCLPGSLREPGCSGGCVPGAARCSIGLEAEE